MTHALAVILDVEVGIIALVALFGSLRGGGLR
jgi:hypothetical protein